MRITWPRLRFPPINLLNAPRQPALEDRMQQDAIQDQLCARIDELESEKEVLNAQLDRREEQLNGLRDQVRALHRIGSALDLDPGTDLTEVAPPRVKALMKDNDNLRREVANWRGA